MKKISLWLAMMALGVVSATAQNLISAIGNFENAKGWDASNEVPSDAGTTGFSFSDENPHSGNKCMMLESSEPVRFSVRTKRRFPVEPGKTYKVSAWMRADKAVVVASKHVGMSARITFGAEDTMKEFSHASLVLDNRIGDLTKDQKPFLAPTPMPTEWTLTEGTFTVPEGATSFIVQLFVNNGVGKFYFDDVAVEPVL